MEIARSGCRRKKGDGFPRWKVPPPRWTDPVLVKAAPLTTRNMEVEELKRENQRTRNEREALMQQVEQNRAKIQEEMWRAKMKHEEHGNSENKIEAQARNSYFCLRGLAEAVLSLRCHFVPWRTIKAPLKLCGAVTSCSVGFLDGFLQLILKDALGEKDTFQKYLVSCNLFVFLRYVGVAFAFRTFNFRR